MLYKKDHVTGYLMDTAMSEDEWQEDVLRKYAVSLDLKYEYKYLDLVRSEIGNRLIFAHFVTSNWKNRTVLFSASSVNVQDNWFVAVFCVVGFQTGSVLK